MATIYNLSGCSCCTGSVTYTCTGVQGFRLDLNNCKWRDNDGTHTFDLRNHTICGMFSTSYVSEPPSPAAYCSATETIYTCPTFYHQAIFNITGFTGDTTSVSGDLNLYVTDTIGYRVSWNRFSGVEDWYRDRTVTFSDYITMAYSGVNGTPTTLQTGTLVITPI